jgi:hypothetical protein
MNSSQVTPHGQRTVAEAVLGNVPYAVMLLLGAAGLRLSLGSGGAGWAAAGGYLAYGLLGALWIILFLCPHCPSFGQWSCPCGYGVISARLRRQGDTSRFGTEFKRQIAVIVPLWIIPAVVGGVVLARGFSWPLAVVLAAFALNSFVILPMASRRHGCKDCAQRGECPWMK